MMLRLDRLADGKHPLSQDYKKLAKGGVVREMKTFFPHVHSAVPPSEKRIEEYDSDDASMVEVRKESQDDDDSNDSVDVVCPLTEEVDRFFAAKFDVVKYFVKKDVSQPIIDEIGTDKEAWQTKLGLFSQHFDALTWWHEVRTLEDITCLLSNVVSLRCHSLLPFCRWERMSSHTCT